MAHTVSDDRAGGTHTARCCRARARTAQKASRRYTPRRAAGPWTARRSAQRRSARRRCSGGWLFFLFFFFALMCVLRRRRVAASRRCAACAASGGLRCCSSVRCDRGEQRAITTLDETCSNTTERKTHKPPQHLTQLLRRRLLLARSKVARHALLVSGSICIRRLIKCACSAPRSRLLFCFACAHPSAFWHLRSLKPAIATHTYSSILCILHS